MYKWLILLPLLLLSCKPQGSDCLGMKNVYGRYITVKNLPLTLNVHPSVSDNFYDRAQTAVAEINKITNKPLLLLTRYQGDYKNNIYAADDWNNRDISEMGVTFYRHDLDSIYQVQIFINLVNYNFKTDKRSFDALIRHELLHSLGMTHSTVSGTLMYPSATAGSDPKIEEQEIKNLRCLYE